MAAGHDLKKPRTKPAEVRREELMDAAQAVFLKKGFTETSVEEIVRAADVAKGTFYLYFKTKDDVLLALRQRFIEGFCGRLDAVVERRDLDWVAKLDLWIETVIDGYLRKFELHDLVFHDYRPSKRRMKRESPPLKRLIEVLEEGRRAGVWQVDDLRLTAVMLFNGIHAAVDDQLVEPARCDRRTLVAGVTAFFHTVLGLPAAE